MGEEFRGVVLACYRKITDRVSEKVVRTLFRRRVDGEKGGLEWETWVFISLFLLCSVLSSCVHVSRVYPNSPLLIFGVFFFLIDAYYPALILYLKTLSTPFLSNFKFLTGVERCLGKCNMSIVCSTGCICIFITY